MFKIVLAAFVGCFLLERIFAGWKLPKVHGWYTRVILINIVQLGIIILAGLSWEKWFSAVSIFQLSKFMNPWLAGFTAYFIATFVFYWWHRIRHESDFFWLHFHQIHHSPQRLEVITSFYKHPLEMTVNSILGSLIVYTLLGLSIEAGAIYTLFTALGEFFYHTNVKTPRWIGYIFQRPEMHRIHHQYNRHKNNYGDFVIWDMIFGTYENPKMWADRCGFDEPKELRLNDMLLFKDVHRLLIAGVVFVGMTFHTDVRASSREFSSWPEACNAAKSVVAEGDIIFLDIPYYLFRQVAKSTNSWTSHVGIVFKDGRGDWIVSESTIPFSKDTNLCDYLKSSADFKFEIKRLDQPLADHKIARMRATAHSLLGQWYTLGFDFDSDQLFCSKFVYLTYQSIGIEVGKLQTFADLLNENPMSSTLFWNVWFLGDIPWGRRTITPASQLRDLKLKSIIAGR
jgi:sterol desaturase/sphingolipid hydroxylase (fatty acid hydroxylase superfamily)